MDTKQTTINTLITAGLITLAMVVPGMFEEDAPPQYFCIERPELGFVECDSFSKYVSEEGKCIRDDKPNLICRSGWLEVKNDIESNEEVEVEFNGLWICESSEPTARCTRGDHSAYYNQIT